MIDSNFPVYLTDIHALAIAFIVGVAIPWLTELITHSSAPSWLRGVLNFGFSALAGILTTIALSDFQTVYDYIFAIAITWVATMRAHYAGMAKPVATRTASFGLGAPSTSR